MLEKIGGRKFAYALLLTVGMFSLAVGGKITYDQLISAIEWIYGLFVVGNVGGKLSTLLPKN